MKVFILTMGTRGDVELFITLGRELHRRGHHVLIGTSPFYAGRIKSAGLSHMSVGSGAVERMAGVLGSLSALDDPKARTQKFLRDWVAPQLKEGMPDVLGNAARADVFISNLNLDVSRATRNVPTALVSYDIPAKVRDLARPVQGNANRNIVDLVAMNRMLVDPDQLWGPHLRFTGFWLETTAGVYPPPRELMRFLVAGTPPVAITLGSMSDLQPARLIEQLVDGVLKAGHRAIVLGGRDTSGRVSDDVFYAQAEIPYLWLFSRSSAVIHHGGIGTVAASLACGTPSILLPHISAQWRIAQVLRTVGVAAGVFNPASLHTSALTAAINLAVHDDRIRRSTTHWKELLSRDGGVEAAANIIETHRLSLGR